MTSHSGLAPKQFLKLNIPESGVSGIETPPPLEELGLEDAVGVEMGVLKLADVTNDRKLSNWRRDSALCNVSSGRMLGIPIENPIPSPCWGMSSSLRFGADDDPEMTAVENRWAVDDPLAANSLRNLR